MSTLWARFLQWLSAIPLLRVGAAGERWVEPSSQITRLVLSGPLALPQIEATLPSFAAFPPQLAVPASEPTPVVAEEIIVAAEVVAEQPAEAETVAADEPLPANEPIPFPGRAA